MSSDDPTKKYPPPEDFETRNNLKQMLTEVVKEVLAQEIIPRLDRIESRLEGLERGQKELLRDFRHYKVQTDSRLLDLEYPQSSQSVK